MKYALESSRSNQEYRAFSKDISAAWCGVIEATFLKKISCTTQAIFQYCLFYMNSIMTTPQPLFGAVASSKRTNSGKYKSFVMSPSHIYTVSPVDVSHQIDVMIAIFHVTLIYTGSIDPVEARFLQITNDTQIIVQIHPHCERSPIQETYLSLLRWFSAIRKAPIIEDRLSDIYCKTPGRYIVTWVARVLEV